MSRKKRQKRDTPNRALPFQGPDAGPPQFRPGDKVRVKAGARDPDYPDFPLGGWAGSVRAVRGECQPRLCEVAWSDATLKGIHPVYQQRCERDGLDIETIWLDEDALVPDPGGPIIMETPGDLVPRPLRPFEQEDRIRAILGATSDEPLPSAGEEQLRRYRAYLLEKLAFPFNAEIWVQSGPFAGQMRLITIYRLLDLEESGREGNGLLAEAGLDNEQVTVPLCDVEPGNDSPHRRLLQDYSCWYCNFGGGGGLDEDAAREPPTTQTILKSALRYSVYGMGFGSVLGALLATQGPWGVSALYIGAAAGTLLGWLLGSRYGLLFGAINRVRGGPAVGGVLGLVAGAVLGGSLGVFLVGCLGTFPGSIVGSLLGKGLAQLRIKPWGELVWALIGACTGGMVLALVQDSTNAVPGALAGAIVGGICTAVLFLFFVVSLGLMLSSRD